MGDRGARRGQRQRRQPGVGEQVQDLGPVATVARRADDLVAQPRQHPGMLREEPDLAGVGRPQLHRQPVDAIVQPASAATRRGPSSRRRDRSAGRPPPSAPGPAAR